MRHISLLSLSDSGIFITEGGGSSSATQKWQSSALGKRPRRVLRLLFSFRRGHGGELRSSGGRRSEMEKGSGSAASGSGDSLDGLKFGKKIYFEDSGGGSGSSKPAAAGKKCKSAAPAGGGLQKPPRCQVEGCSLDLTGTKAYYCRHKVCGPHSKSPRVTVAGLEQRFCQQCSRFHLLSEFDQVKRSCRRRLAGHNERRRKPPPGPLISRFGQLSSFQDDSSRYRSYLMDLTYPRSTLIPDNQWQGSFDAQTGFATSNSNPALFAAPKLALGDCLVGVPDSSCALSLLSSQPWDATAAAAAAPPGNHESPLIPASGRIDCGPMAQLNMASSYMNGHWGFKDLVSESSSIEMGLSNCHFSSELELALQGNKQRPDELELGHQEVYGPGHSKMHRSL